MNVGDRFGRLVVQRIYGPAKARRCECICDCGSTTQTRTSSLKAGWTRSCGCFRSERMAGMNLRHGETYDSKPTPEWVTWRSMRQRCEDPKHKSFARYGGRGIRVCERWQSFDQFLADMGRRPGPKMQIDRIDNDGNYEPANCKWSTGSEQARNRRARPRSALGQFMSAKAEKGNR